MSRFRRGCVPWYCRGNVRLMIIPHIIKCVSKTKCSVGWILQCYDLHFWVIRSWSWLDWSITYIIILLPVVNTRNILNTCILNLRDIIFYSMNIALEKDNTYSYQKFINLYLRNFIHFRCAFGVRFANTNKTFYSLFFFNNNCLTCII